MEVGNRLIFSVGYGWTSEHLGLPSLGRGGVCAEAAALDW